MREIQTNEVYKLLDCVESLSAYHNEISIHFKGAFPSKPYEKTLENFENALNQKEAYIAVVEDKDEVVGFCKVDVLNEHGKLDYLVVKEEFRGKGFGKELMDWAMHVFEQNQVKHIEVKVIDGNPALHLYEKYGFKMKSHTLGIER